MPLFTERHGRCIRGSCLRTFQNYLKQEHFIVLKDVKGVPVVIKYTALKDNFDEFRPVAEKVLQSAEWTGT